MHNPETIEKALFRLIPVAMSDGAQADIEKMIDDLEHESDPKSSKKRFRSIWIVAAGIAATAAFGVFMPLSQQNFPSDFAVTPEEGIQYESELVYLAESDRVDGVSDEGLYVDAGGSAVRKVRVRMIEESQVRDQETGIVLTLSEPREEMYMMPVSTF